MKIDIDRKHPLTSVKLIPENSAEKNFSEAQNKKLRRIGIRMIRLGMIAAVLTVPAVISGLVGETDISYAVTARIICAAALGVFFLLLLLLITESRRFEHMVKQLSKIRIGVFTDAHYSPAELTCGDRYNFLSLGKIREALDFFRTQAVDACFCLGDLTDICETPAEAEKCLNEVSALLRAAQEHYPVYIAPGNHDYATWKRNQFFEKLGVPCPPYCVRIKNTDFVFLDANYDEQMRSFDSVDFKWEEAYLPPDGIEFLRKTLDTSADCVPVVHELLDPTLEEHHTIRNAGPVRKLLEDSGKVRLVLQGHYHYGGESMINGIRYKTFGAMCVGRENHCFVLEL